MGFVVSNFDQPATYLTIQLLLVDTVKPVLEATSIMQATCIKRPVLWFPIKTNKYKCTCIKQAPALKKHFSVIP